MDATSSTKVKYSSLPSLEMVFQNRLQQILPLVLSRKNYHTCTFLGSMDSNASNRRYSNVGGLYLGFDS